jgi:hypothetical protein
MKPLRKFTPPVYCEVTNTVRLFLLYLRRKYSVESVRIGYSFDEKNKISNVSLVIMDFPFYENHKIKEMLKKISSELVLHLNTSKSISSHFSSFPFSIGNLRILVAFDDKIVVFEKGRFKIEENVQEQEQAC